MDGMGLDVWAGVAIGTLGLVAGGIAGTLGVGIAIGGWQTKVEEQGKRIDAIEADRKDRIQQNNARLDKLEETVQAIRKDMSQGSSNFAEIKTTLGFVQKAIGAITDQMKDLASELRDIVANPPVILTPASPAVVKRPPKTAKKKGR